MCISHCSHCYPLYSVRAGGVDPCYLYSPPFALHAPRSHFGVGADRPSGCVALGQTRRIHNEDRTGISW
jgi:hypothetical protein